MLSLVIPAKPVLSLPAVVWAGLPDPFALSEPAAAGSPAVSLVEPSK